MVKKESKSSNSSSLSSDSKLAKPVVAKNLSEMPRKDINRLVKELEAYQDNLELQSNALLNSNAELLGRCDQFNALFDQASVGYVSTDKKGLIVETNPTLVNMLGVSSEELINHPLTDFIAQKDHEGYLLTLDKIAQTRETQSCDLSMIDSTKSPLWVRMNNAYVKGFESDSGYFRAVIYDITALMQSEQDLKKISRAVESSSSVVIITDLEGVIEYVNPKFTELTGYTRKEAVGQKPRILRSGEASDKQYAELWKTITAGIEWVGDFHNRRKDGSYYWARNSISGVKDEQGKITHYICIQEDITRDYELNEQLSFQASHDALTGLFNRREFLRQCEKMLSNFQQGRHEHALCFMDLDQFEQINDSCGHVAGYELLRQLAQVLQNTVRRRDTLARLNGDEFSVLLEHCSLDQAHRVATEILHSVNEYQFYWEGKPYRVGASIGLVAITNPISNLTDLLSQADAACYMAKKTGRNRIHVYHTDTAELMHRQSESKFVSRINEVLNSNGFILYGQSIVSANGSGNQSVELLLRMEGEDEKLISPGVFIPIATRYDLIEKLDSWVVNKAFGLLAENPEFLNRHDYVSINLSGHSLNDDEVLDLILTRLKDTEINPDKICLELSEMAVISNLNSAIRFISILKEVGCRFALDDFGRGLSSFGYLKNLPVDYLKINGFFVKDILDDPVDLALVKSINEIGQVMGLKTIAEFVENDEIMKLIKKIGIDYAQGYGIQKPKPFEEMLAE